ncbi:MAG: murein transglycosylase A [Betaproteobacteria bacterium]
MNANKASAPRASSSKIHMGAGYPSVRRRVGWTLCSLGLLAALLGCGSNPRPAQPAAQTVPSGAQAPRTATGPAAPGAMAGGSLASERAERRGAVWVRVNWDELPGFQQDTVGEVLPALRASCPRAGAAWRVACEQAARLDADDHHSVRLWMVQHLSPWRIEDRGGGREGLLTGYYEPHFEARRLANAEFAHPLHRPPADLAQRRPYWTRQQLESVREARAALQGRELAYLRDPIDALVLQIQGSGRLTITEADGRRHTVRLAFAGHNDHPYGSVGRWLIETGQLPAAQAGWPGIKAWVQRNPKRLQELLWKNPRVVFFQEEALSDPRVGPRGAMGVPLSPQRSIAVDPTSVPYGTAVWIHSPGPIGAPVLQRVVVAQDTGSAIVGAVRGDYFWGWGDEAGEWAGRLKGRLQMWALWPQGHRPPP